MELNKNLLELCKKRSISIATLSRMSGVKQPTLHGWTTGRSVQNLDDLKKVCDALEVGVHTLLYGKPDPYEKEDLSELFKGDVRITIHRIKQLD
jgi:transcriptional regulator with XRE-family HTH domain